MKKKEYKMQFRVVAKKEKKEQLRGGTELAKRLRAACRKLKREHDSYCDEQLDIPTYGFPGDETFEIRPVPQKAIPELRKTFADYVEKVAKDKGHDHKWKPLFWDNDTVTVKCRKCEETEFIPLKKSLTVMRAVLRPHLRKRGLPKDEKVNALMREKGHMLLPRSRQALTKKTKTIEQQIEKTKSTKVKTQLKTRLKELGQEEGDYGRYALMNP
jgi:hypothetical protein